MTRTIDRIKALEAAFAPPPVRVSLCAPVPEFSHEQWQELAMQQQAFLIATGKDDIDRAAAREAKRNAEHAPEAPPQRKQSPQPAPRPFVHVPSIFARH